MGQLDQFFFTPEPPAFLPHLLYASFIPIYPSLASARDSAGNISTATWQTVRFRLAFVCLSRHVGCGIGIAGVPDEPRTPEPDNPNHATPNLFPGGDGEGLAQRAALCVQHSFVCLDTTARFATQRKLHRHSSQQAGSRRIVFSWFRTFARHSCGTV